MDSGIYQIVNKRCGTRYIGSSKSISFRLNTHRSRLRAGTHCNQHLLRAWNKYGAQSFRFEPLLTCEEDSLLKLEQGFLDHYADRWEDLYNINPIAGGSPDNQGSKHGMSKLDEAQVLEIRQMYADGGHTFASLAEMFGTSTANIGGIIRGTHWKHCGGPTSSDNSSNQVSTGSSHGMSKLDESSVLAIREAYAAGGITYKELGSIYSVTKQAIWHIIKRNTWTHI